MAKSSYNVKPGNIFGRLGAGIGQGLAEQVPKEIERNRLASGLQQFEQESANLSPMQQLARLSAIPGITPQMIQSFGELGKQQALRSSLKQRSQSQEVQGQDPRVAAALEQMNTGSQAKGSIIKTQEQGLPAAQENVAPNEMGQPQVVPENPLRDEALPVAPWTSQQKEQRLSDNWESNPGLTWEQVNQKTNEDEQRYLNQPKAEQDKDNYRRTQQNLADNKFKELLETKLQKSGIGVYKDITGENLINLKRGMEKEIASSPDSIDDIANKWTNKALDLAKTKNQFNEFVGDNWFATPILFNKEKYASKLKEYAKTFKESGNSEEYYNLLRSDLKMSPQGAATYAYETNPQIKSYISEFKPGKIFDPKGNAKKARKIAIDLESKLTPDDSLLSIARAFRVKDPNFDQQAFFDQLSRDKDDFGMRPRQVRELQKGASDILPFWGDVLFLPLWGG